MNADMLQGRLKQIKGHLRMHWGRWADDPQAILAGQRDQRIGLIQQAYGIAKRDARRCTQRFMRLASR